MKIWTFFLLLVPYSFLAAELQRENVPDYTKEASQRIDFSIQKDFKDGSLKLEFLRKLKSCFEIDIFVETGTHFGDTAKKASEVFSSVHTIELFPQYYHLTKRKFKNIKNVHLHFGNSDAILSSVLQLCNGRTLFYLDGHYDGGINSGKGTKNTPIMEELAAIRAWGRKDAVILIDDICDFQNSLYPDRVRGTCFENYPDLKELLDEILKINPSYQICFVANALLAFPPHPDTAVSPVMRACAMDRLSTIASLFTEEELLEAERTIGLAQGMERKELENYFHAYSDFEFSNGWRSFAGFWMGLLLMQEEKRHDADRIFQKTAQHSLPNWRIHNYLRDRLRFE